MNFILETSRLVLREMSVSDLDFLADLLGDPEVMRFWPAPYSRQQAREWIERQRDRYARHGCGYWLAIEKASNQPVGQAGVMITAIDGVEEAALGWIMDPAHWRRGFAFESARACMSYIFYPLDRPVAIALIRPENDPSLQLARKLGMTARKTIVYSGLDHIVFMKSRP